VFLLHCGRINMAKISLTFTAISIKNKTVVRTQFADPLATTCRSPVGNTGMYFVFYIQLCAKKILA